MSQTLMNQSINPRGGDAAAKLLSPSEFTATLKRVLEARYHHLHPFNLRMHRGELSKTQIRGWVANRFYYQENIPVKDALLLAKLPASERRQWLTRIVTHDGVREGEGGLEAWLKLADAAQLPREVLVKRAYLQPGVRFAVDAYVTFVRDKPWLEGVASSLTELFAPMIMKGRTVAFEEHYPWLELQGLAYFRARLSQAPLEAEHGLSLVLEHATTPETQRAAIRALEFKCEVLWSLLDAVMLGYPE